MLVEIITFHNKPSFLSRKCPCLHTDVKLVMIYFILGERNI